MSDLLLSICSDENINSALEHLKIKKDTCGTDGMYLSELHEYLEFNKKSFVESVLNGNYEFGIAEKRELLNKNGKKRDIIILNSIDRLLMRMVYQVLYKFTADCYSENSYAYQEGKGIVDAVEKSKSYILTGLNYVAELDIHKYFDNIEHKLLCKKTKIFQN